jgi:hypothetical protein
MVISFERESGMTVVRPDGSRPDIRPLAKVEPPRVSDTWAP